MIWWLASYPKSGNTWLRMFLSAYRHGGQVNINVPWDVGIDDLQEYFYHALSPRPLGNLTDLQRLLLRPATLLHLIEMVEPTRPLFVKTHFANCQIGGVGIDVIPSIISNGAIYLVRDPRDVAISWAKHRGVSIDQTIQDMNTLTFVMRRGQYLSHYLSTWNAHVKSWTVQSNFPVLVVKYEDLVENPLDNFREILKFLKHEIGEELLRIAVDNTSFAALKRQENRLGFRERRQGDSFFNKGEPGAWREVLSSDQVSQLEHHHGEMMREFGYLT